KGKIIEEALKITRDDVANELGGLPAIKLHCSNLAADALREAIKDYRSKK
ncbi:MAG: iron-sulfur cluster assembly scaffold protein, partial [Thermoplasmatales archaeon]|nr:iron-sulfur cluster assembly scaffold protein [Thermoplasmatales archaeon]